MKKLFLAGLFGLLSFAVKAQIINVQNSMPASPCAVISVWFVASHPGSGCPSVDKSATLILHQGNNQFNLSNPAIWAPAPPPPAGCQFSATVCATCPGLGPVCLPLLGAPCYSPHQGPVTLPCCPNTIQAIWTSSVPPYQLIIQP